MFASFFNRFQTPAERMRQIHVDSQSEVGKLYHEARVKAENEHAIFFEVVYRQAEALDPEACTKLFEMAERDGFEMVSGNGQHVTFREVVDFKDKMRLPHN